MLQHDRRAASGLEYQDAIVTRFRALVEGKLDYRLNVEETSRQVGITSRSLRYACQNRLGLSPSTYILRRRMDLVRRALQQGNCSVGGVARQFGFSQLGRFAVSYRKLYGETPSITLKLAAGGGERRSICELVEIA
jgi:AraC-like DNA-binding protein